LGRGGGIGGDGFLVSARLTGTCTAFLGGSAGGLGCCGAERRDTLSLYRKALPRTELGFGRVTAADLTDVEALSSF